MNGGIYLIVSQVTGLIYVGSSRVVDKRLRGHKRLMKQLKHPNWKIHRDTVRHGVNSFTFIVIERCTCEELLVREQFWIDKFQAADRGYNIMRRANESNSKAFKGHSVSEETRQKIREARSKQVITLEHRAAISRSNKGRKVSEEGRYNMSLAQRGKHHSEEAKEKMRARVYSAETRKKMSLARLGRRHSDETRAKMRLSHSTHKQENKIDGL